MSDLKELYQQVILDHNKHPRNCHKLDHANRQANGFNPLCGDKVSVYMQIENGVVKDIGSTTTAGTGDLAPCCSIGQGQLITRIDAGVRDA